MRKKILSVLLAAVMAAAIIPAMAFGAEIVGRGTCGPNLTWTLDSEGTLTISGKGNMADYTSSDYAPWAKQVAPSDIKKIVIEYGITSIGSSAFPNCRITEITIPESVTSIGQNAFGSCEILRSIDIPDSVTSIGVAAFSYCTGMTDITLPESVTSIGDAAFSDCSSLKSVKIPNGVTSIGTELFQGCESLTSAEIPDSVTSIGDGAFYGCKSLKTLDIPEGVTSIGLSVFSGCTGLTSINADPGNTEYSSEDGVLFNKNKTDIICYPAGKTDKSYIIPESVTTIKENAFNGCSSLTGITIPDSVTSIGNGAFRDCTALKRIAVPNGVTSIGEWTFYGCSALAKIDIPVSVTSVGRMAFWRCSILEDVYYGGTSQDWSKISISSNNEPFKNAEIHFNSGVPEPQYYNVSVNAGLGGFVKVTADEAENVPITKAVSGTKITVTAVPDSGYRIDKITYTPEGGSPKDITYTRSFTMPEADVTVDVTFKEKPSSGDFLPGDLNADRKITAKDKAILNRYLAGWAGYKDQILSWDAADINGDGEVTAKDKAILNRYLAGWTGYEIYFE